MTTDHIGGSNTRPGLADRAKNIIMTPKTEWPVVASETPDVGGIATGYAIPLILLSTIASFIGSAFLGGTISGNSAIMYGVAMALVTLMTALIGLFLSAMVLKVLAPTFDSNPDFGRAFQTAAYAATPGWVAGILTVIPILGGLLAIVGGLYGIYLYYLGLPHVMSTPKEKVIGYMVVAAIVMIVVGVVLALILTPIMLAILGVGAVGSALL